MTHHEQHELLKLVRENLASVYSSAKYKFNDVDFAEQMQVCFAQLDVVIREFGNGFAYSVEIAAQYMKDHPNADAREVGEYARRVMEELKDV